MVSNRPILGTELSPVKEKKVSDIRRSRRLNLKWRRVYYNKEKLQDMEGKYREGLKELENLFGETHWIPSFVYLDNEHRDSRTDKYLFIAEIRLWKRIRSKFVPKNKKK